MAADFSHPEVPVSYSNPVQSNYGNFSGMSSGTSAPYVPDNHNSNNLDSVSVLPPPRPLFRQGQQQQSTTNVASSEKQASVGRTQQRYETNATRPSSLTALTRPLPGARHVQPSSASASGGGDRRREAVRERRGGVGGGTSSSSLTSRSALGPPMPDTRKIPENLELVPVTMADGYTIEYRLMPKEQAQGEELD